MEAIGTTNNTLLKAFGFTWRNGRSWGVAHPKHDCYANAGQVTVHGDGIHLGVTRSPRMFNGKMYEWGVGYISSIETIKYGRLDVVFTLPQGPNLWPAIWLTDGKTWPPEIDIVEAWSNNTLKGKRCYRRVWNGIPIPFVNDICPGSVYGDHYEIKQGKTYANFCKGTPSSWLYTDGTPNICTIEWDKDHFSIWYNNHKVAEERDKEVLKWFNASEGMEIHLNNYVRRYFNEKDYAELMKIKKERQKLIIHEVFYHK